MSTDLSTLTPEQRAQLTALEQAQVDAQDAVEAATAAFEAAHAEFTARDAAIGVQISLNRTLAASDVYTGAGKSAAESAYVAAQAALDAFLASI